MNKTKLIINSEYDITDYILKWHIYMQDGGYGLVLICKHTFEDIKDSVILKIESIEITNKKQLLKLESTKPPIINIHCDKFAEIWMYGGVLS